MKKIGNFALFMTEHCWGSPSNHIESRFLADALIEAVELKTISLQDIHYGTDQEIWNLLNNHTDKVIQEKMAFIKDSKNYHEISSGEQADLTIKPKFRGIDPWINKNGSIVRLTDLDSLYALEYARVKKRYKRGWNIKLTIEKSLTNLDNSTPDTF